MKKTVSLAAVALAALLAFQSESNSQAPAADYQVDPIHSVVVFGVHHFGAGRFYGRFNKIEGAFSLNDGGNGSIDVTVDADSIDTAFGDRDKHLKSPQFFSVKQFPTITFKSDRFKRVGENAYQATGKLTMRGVTREVTAPIEYTGSGKGMKGEERVGFEARLNIKRSDFGMDELMGPVGDEIRLIIAIEGVKK